MLCLREMGYPVESLRVHSLSDNKRYDIPLPNDEEWKLFLDTIKQIRSAGNTMFPLETNLKKCKQCIYRPLCRGDVE